METISGPEGQTREDCLLFLCLLRRRLGSQISPRYPASDLTIMPHCGKIEAELKYGKIVGTGGPAGGGRWRSRKLLSNMSSYNRVRCLCVAGSQLIAACPPRLVGWLSIRTIDNWIGYHLINDENLLDEQRPAALPLPSNRE